MIAPVETAVENRARMPWPDAGDQLDKSGRRVRRMFASIARRYDFLNHLLSLNIDRSWRTFTTQVAAPEPGSLDPRLLHGHGRPGSGL